MTVADFRSIVSTLTSPEPLSVEVEEQAESALLRLAPLLADEFERLTAENERLKLSEESTAPPPTWAELENLQIENARLRSELLCPCTPCSRGNYEECEAPKAPTSLAREEVAKLKAENKLLRYVVEAAVAYRATQQNAHLSNEARALDEALRRIEEARL